MCLFKKKFLKYIVLVSFGFLSSELWCQEKESRIENALLWQITGNGLRQPSYIFGTIHSICLSDISFSDTLLRCIRNSKDIFLEININNDTNVHKANRLENETLKNLLGARYFKKALQVLNGYKNLSEAQIDSLQPFLLKSYLTEAAMNCKTVSVDGVILALARKYLLSIKTIESFEEHYQPVFQIPLRVQARLLKSQLDNLEKYTERLNEEIVLYKNEKVNEIYLRSAYDEFLGRKDGVELFLDQRNLKWANFISKNILNGQAFFAFGCAHLGGELGVINLLRKKGYLLIPVFDVVKSKPIS